MIVAAMTVAPKAVTVVMAVVAGGCRSAGAVAGIAFVAAGMRMGGAHAAGCGAVEIG